MIIAMQDQCMFNVTMEGDVDKNGKKSATLMSYIINRLIVPVCGMECDKRTISPTSQRKS